MSHMRRTAALAGAVFLLTASALAAQTPGTRDDSLRRAVAALEGRVDSLARGQCPGDDPIAMPGGSDSVGTALARLADRVARLRAERCSAVPAVAADSAPADDLAAIRAAAALAAGRAPADSSPPDSLPDGTRFVGRQRNASILNPEISATGDFRLSARDEGPQADNADLREVEVAIQSVLDPFSSAKMFLTFSEEEVGVEEGYITWTGLPGRVRVEAGKLRQQVGDLNRWHLHALPETEYPLVYQRFFGDEGLEGIGVSLYTSLPFSLAGATHEVWVQGTSARSDVLYAGGRQPTLLGRLQNFWQLTPSVYAQIGVTATGGNSADAGLKSRLVGGDVRVTWRPPQSGTRNEVTFRAEGYRLHSDEAGTVTDRYGTFLDLQARATRRWVFGVRYDWVEAPRGLADTEWRITPALTWWQSEFVYLRLQGQHRDSDLLGSRNELTLQAVWAMGPHKHETY